MLLGYYAMGETSGVVRNSQWGSYSGGLGWSSQPPKAIRDLSRPEARGFAERFLQFFNKNNTFIRIFRPNSYLKK